MPAKRKTTPETEAALRRLWIATGEAVARNRGVPGLEATPGYTLGGRRRQYRNPEPRVFVARRRLRTRGTTRMTDAHPLVTALWDTLPEGERRRSRLFFHCDRCPVRFTKKGAIADSYRCGRVGVYSAPSQKERATAELRASTDPRRLDPQNEFEEGLAQVWDELSALHRRTLYAWLRPASEGGELGLWSAPSPDREWALEGAPSPEAFRSRIRTAERAAARALAGRVFPDRDYSIKTRGRKGFDYERLWEDYLSVGQMP
jgi:hypothetical protein